MGLFYSFMWMTIFKLFEYLYCLLFIIFKDIKTMLTIKELEVLIELLNKKQETLELVEEIFLSKFKDSDGVFRASYALSNLLNLNLLTSLQRIPAIFLLIQNYKTEGINHHPFGATIFELVQNTPEPFEKKMISDMVIDANRQQYSKVTVEQLYEKQQTMINPIEDRIQILNLKQQFVANLPNISKQSQSQVKNVIRDFVDKERQIEIPEYHVNVGTIKQAQINQEVFNVGFMRPIPKFIDVDPSQFHWLSPSLYSQVTWDSTFETSKKLAKAKTLFAKSLQQHLTKDQCSELERCLESQQSIILQILSQYQPSSSSSPSLPQPTASTLNALLHNNPFLAVSILVKLSNYPIFDKFLQLLESQSCDLTVNSIDVVSRVVKLVKVPSDFVIRYTNGILERVMAMGDDKGDKDKERGKLARIVINFVKNLKKSKLGVGGTGTGFEQIQQKLDKFIEQFITVEEVQQFKKLMNKQ